MSKSLGTLTLDLVARTGGFEQGMDKAARKSQKTAKQIERYSNQIGAALTAGTAAAVTGMAALVASTANGAREIKNLSALAGATPQEFQKLTYAAKRYGIEQDKVSDILKDTNDRIGDFIQTGGGPLADFMENIAPKVGVTADEFARLSGPDALQLYVRSLEEAGVSQKDMTFYMEAIASDATALIPLLRDNGKEMKALGDEAERTGNVFSDMDFEQLESIRQGMDELTGAATGMKNEVVMAALPAIEDLVDMLSDEETLESAKSLGMAIVESVKFAVEAVDGAVKVTKFLAEELAALIHGPAFGDLPRMQEELEEQEALVKKLQDRAKLPWGPSDSQVAEAVAKLEKLREQYQLALDMQENATNGTTGTLGGPEVNTPSAPTGTSTVAGSNGGGSTLAPPSIATGDEIDMQSRVDAIRQAFETERQEVLRIYGERNEEIAALYEADAISKMEADHLKIQSEERMQERLAEIRQKQLADEQNLEQQRQALILAGTENLFGSMADLAGEFAGKQSAVYKTMFAVQKAASIAQSIVAINTGIAQAAAVPFPANLAAMASVASATAGIIGNIESVGLNLSGQAHDGIMSVPEDGTWNLKKGERVTTAETSAKLDATLNQVMKSARGGNDAPIVNITEDRSKAGSVQARQNDNGQWVIDVIVADALSGGPASRTYESVYGMKRRGR